jgi:aminopeptidase N
MVSEVVVGGRAAGHEQQAEKLKVTPVNMLRDGDTFVATVAYNGKPQHIQFPSSFALGWWYFDANADNPHLTGEDKGAYVNNEPFGAHAWFPVNDHPCDKATYTLHLTVAKPYMALGNGVLKEKIDNGTSQTFVWEPRDPMASYLVTVVVGDFVTQDVPSKGSVPIRNYFLKGTPEQAREPYAKTAEMLDYFSNLFGPYPFETYGSVELEQDLPFGYETQTLSTIGRDHLDETAGEAVVAHELAHQWFGDSVSLATWKDVWLNEGFATYATALWFEHSYGREAFDQYMHSLDVSVQLGTDVRPPGDPYPYDLFQSESVYNGGALVLHALRAKIGDEPFFRTLRTYTEKYRYGNATSEDFIAVAEEVSGQHLSDFMGERLYGYGSRKPAITRVRPTPTQRGK